MHLRRLHGGSVSVVVKERVSRSSLPEVRQRTEQWKLLQGRRSADDERQIGRWARCAGDMGR